MFWSTLFKSRLQLNSLLVDTVLVFELMNLSSLLSLSIFSVECGQGARPANAAEDFAYN